MAPRTAAVLNRVLSTPDQADVCDRELLQRFAANGDQSAFTTLVRRHGALVLGVCRRSLRDTQDAEDACQATFVLLARKAARGYWQPSIANWLYAAARKVARNARVAADRRARREGKAPIPETVALLDQMSGRELLAVLDEELDRLPPRYREPLVLCYLQGLTRDEAASRLGVPPATLKSQLDRGRKRLGDALTRRGVALGAGLMALSATSRAGAVPARVVNSVLSAVRSSPSKTVAELCRGVAMNGTHTKAVLLAVAVIGAAILGVGAVSPMSPTAAEQKSDMPIAKKADGEAKQSDAKAEQTPAQTYTGTVIGPDRKPVKGAAVFAFESAGTSDTPRPRDRVTVRTNADAEGKFRITLPAGKTFMVSLFATAEGFGIGRIELRERTDELTIPMVLDNPVTGRVVTTEGKPVAGARIKIERIADDIAELDDLLNRLKAWGHHVPLIRRSMPVGFPALGTSSITGKDGGFRLNGGGRERVLYVEIQADGFASEGIVIGNRPKFDPTPYNDAANKRAAEMRDRPPTRADRLYSPSGDLVLEPQKPIRGTVKDAETGKPRAGVQVKLSRTDQTWLRISAITDAKGQYEIRGARKAARYELVVDGGPAIGPEPVMVRVEDTPGFEPITVDMKLRAEDRLTKETPAAAPAATKSIPVTGRVLDPDGKPVAGAKFTVIDDEDGTPVPKATSGLDGRFAFQIPHPYPQGIVRNPRQVVASAPGFGLAWLSEPREDAVFQLVPDQPITGRVIDLEGKPVAGARVAVHDVRAGPPGAFDEMLKHWNKSAKKQEEVGGKLDRSIWNRGGLAQAFHTTTAADGTFSLKGLGKDRVVTILATADGIADTYAAVATRDGYEPAGAPRTQNRLHGPKLNLVVSPDKPIAGVVRDADTGTPLTGVRVAGASTVAELQFGSYIFHAWPTPTTTTDKQGRFTLRGLAKGKAYVLVADPDEGSEHLHRFDYVEDTIGFAPITTGFSLPRGVILTGRVTDASTGAGVPSRVFYRPLQTNELVFEGYGPADYPAPWHRGRDTKTDLEGRYKITVAAGAGVLNFQAYGGSYERARATQKEIDDGIVDKQFGHFRTLGQGGMFNPEFMHVYKIISPAARDRKATLDVMVKSAAPKEAGDGK